MNIYLLRHGETEWNRKGRLQGRTDIALNQTGRMQMQQVADVMDSLRLGIDLIIASPLVRARESAEIVAERIKYKKENIVTEPLLIERCFGVGEGLTISEREEKYHGDNYPEMELFEDLIPGRVQKCQTGYIFGEPVDAGVTDTKYCSILFCFCNEYWVADGGEQVRLYTVMG